MEMKVTTKPMTPKHEKESKATDLKSSQNKSLSSNIHKQSKKNLDERGKGKENENENLNRAIKMQKAKETKDEQNVNMIDINENPNNESEFKDQEEQAKDQEIQQQTNLSDKGLKENLNFEKTESTNKDSENANVLQKDPHHENKIKLHKVNGHENKEKEKAKEKIHHKKEGENKEKSTHREKDKEKENLKPPNKTFSSKKNLRYSASGLPNENKKSKTPSGRTNKEIKVEKKESSPKTKEASEPNKANLNINIPKSIENQENNKDTNEKKYIEKFSPSESLKKEGNLSQEKLETDESEKSDSIPEIRDLFEKNKKFVNETLEANPEFLKEMCAPQHPIFLIISCSDSRILTSKILGTHPGELFVHRNIGNIVLSADFNLQTVISYAVEHLKVRNIIVLGHTDCGAIRTSLSNDYHGLVDHWLKPVKDLVERNHDLLDDVMKKEPHKITNKLSELNVKEQVINLCKNPIIQKAWHDGEELFIHGLMFDIETGLIKDLQTMKKQWKPNQDIHT